MPVPEKLRVYGRTDILIAVGQQQPTAPNPPWVAANRHRQVTRTITFHYNHGWKSGNWRSTGTYWVGATFNLDLDGTLYQCEEMIVRTNHVGGGPDFTGAYSFVNDTSIGIELARFGLMRLHNDQYQVNSYGGINFNIVPNPPDECNYSQLKPLPGRTHRFSLRKMRGEICLNSAKRPYYYTKIATFNDARNKDRKKYPLDVVFTEEQYQTLVLWAKSMCEMHRIPKTLLADPATGKEQPWLDVTDLIQVQVQVKESLAKINENKERIVAFQGMIGHNNVQRDRKDPGASLDYYRIKRGVSDQWWYPVNLNDGARVMDYLDTTKTAQYMELTEYNNPSDRNRYYLECEGDAGGYFPIGLNRLWHGGVHFPSGKKSRQVYAMANGKVVAARITNGVVNTSTQRGYTLRYSRCFVLIRHEVHVYQDKNHPCEISYGANSTETVYSLYMHTAPLTVQLNKQGIFTENFSNYPAWFNHHMIDYATANRRADNRRPTDPAPLNGDIFYPNQWVQLGDWIGNTGDYVVGYNGAVPRYGPTIHVEVFTTADVSRFGDSPWSNKVNRVSDTTEDLVCDLDTLDSWLQDKRNPGIDALDIRSAVPDMRGIAVQHRSEWSIENREQLSHQIVVGQPARRVDTVDVITQNAFAVNVQPLCFHAEMVANNADPNIIGPYLNNHQVWHLHPLEFMRWMNERVDKHESIMRAQDKQRRSISNLVMTGDYITGFVPPVPPNPPNGGYPEATWNDNTYEISVNFLCDQIALAAKPQTNTRFHRRLLETIDIINDRPHGLTVLLGHATTGVNANSVHAIDHIRGDACDVRPAIGTTVTHWYNFFRSATRAVAYMNHRDGPASLEMTMLQDANAAVGRVHVTGTPASNEWLRRLQKASEASDPILTTVDPAFPNLQAELDQMRLHLHAR